ncbi:MAG: bile acid:sodium symporter family protein [Candidatus Gastranaerophilales bacterium]|nr:bile acid:sodium symporter family protein [Candidatus Gastranaerophilales bacterium]
MEKIKNILIKYMAIIVLIVAGVSFFIPKSSLWISVSWINYLLMVIMFGMGLTLKPDDFILIFKRPKDIICGIIAQYSIMPFIAFILCYLFHLNSALTAGVVLVGTCPGGTSSNVITYLSKGDIALSVCMTGVNTLLSVVLTPLITYFILKTTIEVNLLNMFLSIVNVILIPIILGFIFNKFFNKFTKKILNFLPVLSLIAICMIVACVVSHNAEKIHTCGFIILSVVILHNALGYILGFLMGKILKMPNNKIKAFSVEIGMQNSGLATSLASTAFPLLPLATVPGAIFSVWHNISGGILAGIYRNWKNE